MDPLRVTGSVGRGDNTLRLCGRWVFIRAGRQGQPCAPDWMKHLPPGRRTLRPKGWSDQRPGERRGNLPPWDRWGNSPDAGRTLRAGEQDGSAQNRRARSAGSSPIAYLKHRRPGAPRPPSSSAAYPGRKPRERGTCASIQPIPRDASVRQHHALIVRSHAASHGVSNDEGSREVRNRGRRGLVLRDAVPSGPAPQDEAMEWPIRQAPPLRHPGRSAAESRDPGRRRERLDPGSSPG